METVFINAILYAPLSLQSIFLYIRADLLDKRQTHKLNFNSISIDILIKIGKEELL